MRSYVDSTGSRSRLRPLRGEVRERAQLLEDVNRRLTHLVAPVRSWITGRCKYIEMEYQISA